MNIDASLVRQLAPKGRLRAALNLGNPVLARSHTAAEQPAGVTIDLTRELARLLGVQPLFFPFETPAAAGAAIAAGEADIGFLAIDPTRAETLHFTSPYVQIEGCYLVREDAPWHDETEIDRKGNLIVVGVGSAYALFLARTLKHAGLVEVPKSEAVVDALASDRSLHAAAGVRQQLLTDAARVPGMRLLPRPFMTIEQAMVLPKASAAPVRRFVEEFVREQRRTRFVAQSLARHGIEGATALL
jgi:polar amino acid transport system substrate-binding protein